MSSTPPSLRAVQVFSIFASTAAAGGNLGLSVFVIPRLLEAPVPVMLRGWARMYQTGLVFPALASLSATGYFFLAYRLWPLRTELSSAANLYLLAGGLCAAFVPYTIAVIAPTNSKLQGKVATLGEPAAAGAAAAEEKVVAADAQVAREESAKYLVDQWGLLNLVRSALLATAGLVGLSASL